MRTAKKVPALERLRDAALGQAPVTSGVHDFYRYPARFPPGFAKAAIEAFTQPGDFVFDPFVGGGTSLVEAQSLARGSAGLDINPLAIMVSRAKTTLYSPQAIRQVRIWGTTLSSRLDLHSPGPAIEPSWIEHDHFRNFDSRENWALRKVIIQARQFLEYLPPKPQLLARCALLRSAQWALDLQENIPSASVFRDYLAEKVEAMAETAENHRRQVRVAASNHSLSIRDLQPLIILSESKEAADHERIRDLPRPTLVLTSPPYPGVYVLYHRWKIRGRRETPFPFVIANSLDGRGMSHYTLGWRQEDQLRTYFENLQLAFKGIAKVIAPTTWVCQMVGFSAPGWQLEKYLGVMEAAGFQETFVDIANMDDGRLWRSVPGRRWFAKNQKAADSTALEVVLFHRLRRG